MIGHAKISGEVCRGVITVHEQETSASLKAKIYWRGGSIAFIRKLGKTSVALLAFEGRHHPGRHHGGRGSPQQRSAPKTSDVTPEGRHSGAHNQAPKNPVARRTSQQAPPAPKTPQTSQKTSSNTPDHSGPVLPAGDFPPLTDAGALRRPTKKTSSQVGTGARAAASSCSSFPTSSPEFLVLKQELAALRAQNAQLLAKIAALEAGSAPVTPASPPPLLTEITVDSPEPTPMCTTPSVSEPSNTEERFQAIENAMTALMAQLTNMGKSIENLSVTVTQQVTSNIKTWLHGNPRSRRFSPLKDINRPSKFSHSIDLPEVSEDSEFLLAQGTEVGVESLPATPYSHYGDST
ncbi:hypothetical protein HPB52_010001 [Rhipicephalus sanguineus]|uniref:Uncharacterized protein n=1 Tax=Rhipicephalus sanguineus TaxID=34632 RepID=A0A9D4SWD6_RHISA|nr:hypothetical protein HPB52_010001 [Rhipicephalus sanguineus]